MSDVMEFKISKPGRDVNSDKPYDFVLDSNYPIIKIGVESGKLHSDNSSESIPIPFIEISPGLSIPVDGYIIPYISPNGTDFYLTNDFVFSFAFASLHFPSPYNNDYKYFLIVDSFTT